MAFPERLFIGGDFDGQRRPVDDAHQKVERPILGKAPVVSSYSYCPSGYVDVRWDIYTKRFIRAGAKVFIVYVLDSMSMDEAFDALIDGYRAPKP